MPHSVRRATYRLVTATVAFGLVAALPGSPASAGLEDDSTSASGQPATAASAVVPMNYAINAFRVRDGINPPARSYQETTREVKRAVEAEGGTILRAYPRIGVVIAHATEASFVETLRSDAYEDVVDSIGATRTSVTTLPDDREILRRPLIEPEPMEDNQWGNTELESLAANEIEDGSEDVLVGVLDSGIDHDHPDLAAAIDADASVDCTNNGILEHDPEEWQEVNGTHGTHVAGTIAAQRNGEGVAGIAPGVKLASIKVVNPDGFIFPEYAICGFMWAPKAGVDVTNNSYYIDPWYFWCPQDEDQGATMEAVRRAIEFSKRRNVISVAAAGNSDYDLANKTTDSSSPNDSDPIPDRPVQGCSDIPTESKGVITVASMQQGGLKSSFSNYGLGVINVSAPGTNILSTVDGGGYGYLSGTSMASPHVAGVVALIRSAYPDATRREVKRILRDTAVEHECGDAANCEGTPEFNGYYGHGVVNALNAVSEAMQSR